MCADENTPQRLGSLLTAVAELTLLACQKNAWIPPGPKAVMFRDYINQLGELLMEAGDAVSKEELSPSQVAPRRATGSPVAVQRLDGVVGRPAVYGPGPTGDQSGPSGRVRRAGPGSWVAADSPHESPAQGPPSIGAPVSLGGLPVQHTVDGHDVRGERPGGDRKTGG